MSEKKINCGFYDYKHKSWNQYELDLNLNIYPCCFFYLNEMEPEGHGKKINDNTIKHIDNSAKTNKIENILQEFNKVLNEKIWKSDKCPSICKQICGGS